MVCGMLCEGTQRALYPEEEQEANAPPPNVTSASGTHMTKRLTNLERHCLFILTFTRLQATNQPACPPTTTATAK